jgi:MFS family permease
MLPSAITGVLGGVAAGRLARRHGARLVLTLGLLAGGVALGFMAEWHDSPWQIVVGMVGIGVASSFNFSAAGMLVVEAVRPHETGVATGVTNVMRMIGGVLGAQIAAAVLAAETLPGSTTPTESAFTSALAIAAVISVAGVAVSLGGRRGTRRGRLGLATRPPG